MTEAVEIKAVEPLFANAYEIAPVLGLSVPSVYKGIAAGEIPHVPVGRRKLIPWAWVREKASAA